MISRIGLRWRLVAWVTGVLIASYAVIFVVVYEQTGAQLRAQIDHDVVDDVAQLSQVVRGLHSRDPQRLAIEIDAYMHAQPFTATSSLLFAVIPGQTPVSNHPESSGAAGPDADEPVAQQRTENELAKTALSGPTALSTHRLADVGAVRFDERIVTVGGLSIRVGAGEPLASVARAQDGIARSLVIAGALALAIALLASYLAGARVSLPLRRMARVAARVDDGDLHPRMRLPPAAAAEVRVLAETFNHMLDRLALAFTAQREFIADASHELRTPLTVIGGQLEVLAAQQDPDPEEIRRVERLVAAEIARTSRLVDDMLLLARCEREDFLRPAEVALAPFVREIWDAATLGAKRRFELSPLPDATLTADPDRLAQALRNLIGNAVEHTDAPAGLVRLDVQPQPGGHVRFAVTDDGPGIDDAQLDRVFERFHRTDSARSRRTGGAGLGLSIVRAIADAHGGTVRAARAPTGGARFELELPGLRPPEGSLESPRAPYPGHGPRVTRSGQVRPSESMDGR
ncbi:MAG: sensor histidine kinase [Solirubrobacteraceae bacterium]